MKFLFSGCLKAVQNLLTLKFYFMMAMVCILLAISEKDKKKLIIYRGGFMKEMVYVVLFICVYFLLQVYVLPKMGIST